MAKPKKTDVATFKALTDMGVSPNAIGKSTGYDPKTVRRYLTVADYSEPEIQGIIAKIKQTHLDDLRLLNHRARVRLHELIDAGDTKVIETLAVADRTFNQIQLLSGQSTQNVDVLTAVIERAGSDLKRSARQRQIEAAEGTVVGANPELGVK